MGMPVISPCTVTKEKAIGDIIESISMEESALAHILNAESEKLQVFLTKPGVSVQQLLTVNQSIKNTIAAISRLELILQAKLEIFSGDICKTYLK